MKVRSRSMLMLAGALVLAGASPIVLAGSGAGATTAQAAAMCGTVHTPSKYKHVVVIMMENHSYGTIYRSSSAPYINKVMKSCGVATNYHNVTHLSLPNYLAVTSGLSVGQLGPYLGDCEPYSCSSRIGANNIFNEVGKVGGWMGFDESMSHNCASSSAGS